MFVQNEFDHVCRESHFQHCLTLLEGTETLSTLVAYATSQADAFTTLLKTVLDGICRRYMYALVDARWSVGERAECSSRFCRCGQSPCCGSLAHVLETFTVDDVAAVVVGLGIPAFQHASTTHCAMEIRHLGA